MFMEIACAAFDSGRIPRNRHFRMGESIRDRRLVSPERCATFMAPDHRHIAPINLMHRVTACIPPSSAALETSPILPVKNPNTTDRKTSPKNTYDIIGFSPPIVENMEKYPLKTGFM